MKEHSKLVGGFLGFLLAGPPGLFLGILIGHFFDKTRRFPQRDPWMDDTQTFNNKKIYRYHATHDLVLAYQALGITQEASKAEVKQAYRRFISRYHPDRLSQKGLSPTELKKALNKSHQIQQAYELICNTQNKNRLS